MDATELFRATFRQNAALLTHSYDPALDSVLIVRTEERDYRAAGFLDGRMLRPELTTQWIPWTQLEAIAGPLPASAGWIFHIGHVGSTLISRLLGELPGFFPVREPQILRTLAELHQSIARPESYWPPDAFAPRLQTVAGWLSRSFAAGDTAVVKASSFVSEIAPSIHRPGGKALLLYVRPEVYLATILGGPASRRETAALAGARLARLHGRLGREDWKLWQLGLGERVALSWACEMTALHRAAEAMGEDALWMDFDAFLAAPAQALAKIAAHFGKPPSPGVAAAAVAGPTMHSYSKAQEHPYTPEVRQQVLQQARVEHKQALRDGLAWLDAAAKAHPAIGQACGIAAEGGK